MNALLARYIDGDLTTEEAAEFLEALEENSDLEAELRAHERLLSLATGMDSPRAPAGFEESVMQRVRARSWGRSTVGAGPRRLRRFEWFAAAAALVLFFAMGWQGSRSAYDSSRTAALPATLATPQLGVMPASWVAGAGDASEWMAVRFAYAGQTSDLQAVSVAGSFNGWDPSEIPMHREGGVWTAVVVLPRGSHEYMFVEDGQRWVPDPSAVVTRDDGFGGQNAVLDLRT